MVIFEAQKIHQNQLLPRLRFIALRELIIALPRRWWGGGAPPQKPYPPRFRPLGPWASAVAWESSHY